MFKTNFRTKVLLPVIVVMILLVAVTVIVVNRAITQQFQAEAQKSLATANNVSHQLCKVFAATDYWRSFRSFPASPGGAPLCKSGDAATMRQPLLDLFEREEKGGCGILHPRRHPGQILDGERQRGQRQLSPAAFESAAAPAVKKALEGTGNVDTVSVGAKLYDVISIPINVDNELIGVLTIGSEIGNPDAAQFSQLTSSQIILFAGGHVCRFHAHQFGRRG